jgi:hypothetical protein
MKNSKRLRIFAVLLPASFPGCGGDGDFRNAEAVPGTDAGITDLSCGLRPGGAYTALPF